MVEEWSYCSFVTAIMCGLILSGGEPGSLLRMDTPFAHLAAGVVMYLVGCVRSDRARSVFLVTYVSDYHEAADLRPVTVPQGCNVL